MFWLMVIGVVALSVVAKLAENKEYAAVTGDGAEFAGLSALGMSDMESAQDMQFMDDMNRLQQMQDMQFMDDMNRLQQMQDMQFMDDMNQLQQMQDMQFMDDMNQLQQMQDMQFMNDMNMLQNQQFMDDMNTFSMNSVTPFEMGGMDMNEGNSFNLFDNLFNDSGAGFGGCDMGFGGFGCGGMF